MRISSGGDMTDASQINLDQARSSREVVDTAASTTGTASGPRSSDSIALSGVSSLVQLALGAGVDTRAGRVQELKQQIDSNQYSIDSTAVSSAIISAHLAGD